MSTWEFERKVAQLNMFGLDRLTSSRLQSNYTEVTDDPEAEKYHVINGTVWFVFFVDPSCEIVCGDLLDTWDSITSTLESRNVRTAMMNCNRSPDTCHHFEINRFPTFLVLEKNMAYDFGEIQEYLPDREDLLNFVLASHDV